MRRVVSLYLPSWPSDRWRRAQGEGAPQAETPVVLTGRVGARKVVVDADRAARALGVQPGLALAQAQARVPGLFVADHQPQEDAAALERIALWALRRYAPLVSVDGVDGLWIDATGVAHLFGGEAELLQDLVQRLARAGAHARAAMADTAGAAWALARHGQGRVSVSARGQASQDLTSLPLAALRLQADAVEGLSKLGLETIGDLERTPRAPLALRFGPSLTRRLDQAHGRLGETFDPITSPELVRVRRPFFEPISAPETIARKTADLVERLCCELETKGLGARKLDLVCERVDGRREAVRIGTAAPLRDPKRLIRLFRDKLGHIDPGFGIEAMSIAAPLTEPLGAIQTVASLDALARSAIDVTGLVDVLANRLGPGKVYRLAPVDSDIPERSVQPVAPTAPMTGGTWPVRWPRPSRLLSPPERVEAMAVLPDQPPIAFTWRGQRRRVKAADGPERIFGEWWKRDAEVEAVRDYFSVEDEAGERFWLYRQGDGELAHTGDLSWFLHGLFA